MGCKCKEKSNALSKYTEDGKPALKPLRGIRKVLSVIGRAIISILLFLIVIIVLPFALLFLIFNAMFGGKNKINLNKLFRLNERKQKII